MRKYILLFILIFVITFSNGFVLAQNTVRSYGEGINKFEDKRVTDTIESETNELTHITLNNGETITATPTHNFFANNKWLEAKDLRAGDILLTVDGNHAYSVGNSGAEHIVRNPGRGLLLK
jgi:intein/homing endonuclease